MCDLLVQNNYLTNLVNLANPAKPTLPCVKPFKTPWLSPKPIFGVNIQVILYYSLFLVKKFSMLTSIIFTDNIAMLKHRLF